MLLWSLVPPTRDCASESEWLPQGTLEASSSSFGIKVIIVDGEACVSEDSLGGLRIIRRATLTIVVVLKLNVIAPANVTPGSKFPVVAAVCVTLELGIDLHA